MNRLILFGTAVVMALALAGCRNSSAAEGFSDTQVQKTEGIDAILAKSNGNWDSLSSADQQTLMKEYQCADLNQTKERFQMATMGMRRRAAGPAAPGTGPNTPPQ